MASASGNYRITKREKGPLQRFKNQNLLLKRFGEMGLQVYRAINDTRTSEEIRELLDMDAKTYSGIIAYMQETGMAELYPVTGKEPEEPERKQAAVEKEEEEERPKKGEKPVEEVEEETKDEEETEIHYEEIKPIEEGSEEEPEKREEKEQEEEAPAEEETEEVEEETKDEEIAAAEEEEEEPKEKRSPVERIIEEKYGAVGLQVYKLIDGKRTAEQIMKETGLTEAKLVEILDFMDEQGIIKLEYPRDKKPQEKEAVAKPMPTEGGEFAPMLEKEEAEEKLVSIVEVPVKAPGSIVKDMQAKAQIMLKFSGRGRKVLDKIDGKKDMIDIAVETGIPLFELDTIMKFMLDRQAIVLKPLTRNDVRKKYGDDGYAVYKRYGKEGLMLYELIGKEMTIKQMGDMVSADKARVADMFLFIHKVLGIDLPIDKEVLYKQLGV